MAIFFIFQFKDTKEKLHANVSSITLLRTLKKGDTKLSNFKCCFRLKGVLITKEKMQEIINQHYSDVEIMDVTEFVEDAMGFMNAGAEDARIMSNIEFERNYIRKLLSQIGGFTVPHPEYPDEADGCEANNQRRLKEIKNAIR